jgi:hypothetical protein
MNRFASMLVTMIATATLAGGTTIDVKDLLSTTGYESSDTDHDGFLDKGVAELCNPAGYVEQDPFARWRNLRWVMNLTWPASIPTELPSIPRASAAGSYAGFAFTDYGYYEVDEGAESDGFGVDEGADFDDGFGVEENPVPEPTCMSVLAVGATMLLGRRNSRVRKAVRQM